MSLLAGWFGKWAIRNSFKSMPIKYIIYLIIGCLIVANFIYIDHLRNQDDSSKKLIESQVKQLEDSKKTIDKKDKVIEQLELDKLNIVKLAELSNKQTAILNTVTKRVIIKKKTILKKLDADVAKIVEDVKIKVEDRPNLISIARIDALYEAYASGETELIILKE
jgi:hypothetical protein